MGESCMRGRVFLLSLSLIAYPQKKVKTHAVSGGIIQALQWQKGKTNMITNLIFSSSYGLPMGPQSSHL